MTRLPQAERAGNPLLKRMDVRPCGQVVAACHTGRGALTIAAVERIAIENAQFALQGFSRKSLPREYRRANSLRRKR